MIAVIGALFWTAIVFGAFPIEDRTNNFVAFLYIVLMAAIIYPIVIVWLIQR